MQKEEFNLLSDNIVSAWRYSNRYSYSCCCPGCHNKAIKSHLLQQHPVLESISDGKNKLLEPVDNDIDPRSGDWSFYKIKNVCISNAFQFRLFCSDHDSSLFKEIETKNSIPESKRDCLLFAFRSACAVRHQEEKRYHIYEYLGDKYPMKEISKTFINRMTLVINNLWDAINGKGDNNYYFRMIKMPSLPLAVSDCVVNESNSEQCTIFTRNLPFNCLFINIIPSKENTLLLLGCNNRFDKRGEYRSIIESIPTGWLAPEYFNDTVKGILLKCNNWCCSPELLEDKDWNTFFAEYERLKVQDKLK